MRRVWLLGLFALTTACAANRANQGALNEAEDSAGRALLHCFAARTVTLDDHISDASTLARGVIEACGVQVESYKRAFYDQKGRPGDQTRFYMMVDQTLPKVALYVVLDVRAKAQR